MNWQAIQNPDGGWDYGRGGSLRSRPERPRGSWMEPTAFVLLAQSVAVERNRESFTGGVRFLRAMEAADGGFRPQSEVHESTWVTALAALMPEGILDMRRYERAIAWLKTQSGRESGWRYRLQQRMNGNTAEYPKGWPWFPGAAAWVTPTSLGIIAFERAGARGVGGDLRERIAAGREFLLARACADGGWNHGTNQALGRDGESYPETTGIALLALRGAVGSKTLSAAQLNQIEKGKAAARRHLAQCRTAEGIAWLRMGLAAHGEIVQAGIRPASRTTMDEALTALAEASVNPLTTMMATAITLNLGLESARL